MRELNRGNLSSFVVVIRPSDVVDNRHPFQSPLQQTRDAKRPELGRLRHCGLRQRGVGAVRGGGDRGGGAEEGIEPEGTEEGTEGKGTSSDTDGEVKHLRFLHQGRRWLTGRILLSLLNHRPRRERAARGLAPGHQAAEGQVADGGPPGPVPGRAPSDRPPVGEQDGRQGIKPNLWGEAAAEVDTPCLTFTLQAPRPLWRGLPAGGGPAEGGRHPAGARLWSRTAPRPRSWMTSR